MEGQQGAWETQVLVIPLPIQGHINPMLQFSKRLASKGVRVTFCIATSTGKSIPNSGSFLRYVAVNDGFSPSEKSKSPDNFIEGYKPVLSQSLTELLRQQSSTKFIVYDSVMAWVLGLAHSQGIDGAPFFTHSCSVSAIFYHAHQGLLDVKELPSEVKLPCMRPLGSKELPSFLYEPFYCPSLGSICINQFSNIEQPKWLFFNTFDKLEIEVVNWMKSHCQWPVKTIGPVIPSMFLDKRVEDDRDYGMNLFKPNADECLKWLEAKEPASVVYVSFGSLAALGKEQMEEISRGLKMSDRCFLWVVRDSEMEKLPADFVEEVTATRAKGLLVGWCNQLEVLAHSSVGCFMTHCGWNSCLEALSLGVPMVAVPQWTDQTTNAKFVSDVWAAGTKAKANERGIVTRDEVELRIREVMDGGGNGDEIRKSALRWKQLAKESVDEGGSSDQNIQDFVDALVSL